MTVPASPSARITLPEHWVDTHPEQHAPPPTRMWQRQLHAVASALFSVDGSAPPTDRLNWTVYQLADLLSQVGGRGAFGFRAALFVITWFAPLMVFRLPTFARLSQQKRMQALLRIENSPLKMLLFLQKTLLCVIYYEHPDVAQEVGFDGLGLLEESHG